VSWSRKVSYIGEIAGSATRSPFRNLTRLKRDTHPRSSTTTQRQVEKGHDAASTPTDDEPHSAAYCH